MELYHGSIDIVRMPEIRSANRKLDYGFGFYTTTSEDQAKSWVIRRMAEKNLKKGFINVYHFDKKFLKTLKSLTFDLPNDKWIDFVMSNRTQEDFTHTYDIVSGPVANDSVYAAFALYEGGVLDKQSLISELKTYKLVDQFLFHTEKALKALTFIEAKEITI